MICLECGRRVLPGHRDCEGDPRATCAAYGCGLPIVGELEPVRDEYRPTVWLGWCKGHGPGGPQEK